MKVATEVPNEIDAVDRPSIEELIQRAREMRPMLLERAKETESNRRVSADVIDFMKDKEFFKVCQPRRYGGFEYGQSALFRFGFELAQACGSSAWCAMIGMTHNFAVPCWPQEAQDDVWGENPGNLVAGMLMPTGQCEATDGGYLVKGRWPYGSNGENSDWLILSAMMPEVDGASPGVGWFLMPANTESLKVDNDSWRVSGLAGSGSKTFYSEEPIFVPEHRVIRVFDVIFGTSPGHSIPGNVQAGFSFSTFGSIWMVAAMLGMAQGALDWFTEAMQKKLKISLAPGAPATAASSPFVQEIAGQASTAIDAAKTLCLAGLAELEPKVQAGVALSTAERVRIRRDVGFASEQAIKAVDLLYEVSGASSSDLDCPMQRNWRDVHAAAKHASLDVHGINSMVGQNLFGLPPMGAH